MAQHITFCVQAHFATASEENLKHLLELVQSSSLTVFTGVGSTGLREDQLERIQDLFDRSKMFVDVSKGNLLEQAGKCVTM